MHISEIPWHFIVPGIIGCLLLFGVPIFISYPIYLAIKRKGQPITAIIMSISVLILIFFIFGFIIWR